jgi:hypothetical protein
MTLRLFLPHSNGVHLQITQDRLKIVEVRTIKRRWWEPWKPAKRTERTVLREGPHQIQAGDTVQFEQYGAGNYAVVVNEQTVLRHGKLTVHRKHGFGMSSAIPLSAPSDTVTP